MPKPPVEIDAKVETDLLARRVARLRQYQKKGTFQAVKDAVVFFTQSAIKETPPKGKSIKKRKIIIYGEGKNKRYKVPYRTARKSGAKWFGKKGDATKFARIIYRKIGKFGWLAAAEKALGEKVPAGRLRVKPEAEQKARQVVSGVKRVAIMAMVSLRSRIRGIGTYGQYAVLFALRKANNRLRTNANRYKREMVKKWR